MVIRDINALPLQQLLLHLADVSGIHRQGSDAMRDCLILFALAPEIPVPHMYRNELLQQSAR